ncbi:peptidylprolyl isomerase [Chroococcus sp. FPU101]|uniref:peptidylprolyl isomerase n=1 Tax=Chroococcus sp. FPU101 TaxID=1974212 RepID=UPI001A8E02E2|nr:peptidylprolyl isomerase [Chroococcus sp. FPU101]GFE70787.1 PpiC-type peptidyl-prolyl cis-trans isomerase [Chroococcus sp. FPU101]
MTTLLSLDSFTFTDTNIIPLLTSYQLIPHLLGEQILDREIATIQCSPEETAQAIISFYQFWGLTEETQQQAWQQRYQLSAEQLEAMATRKLRIEKYKESRWGTLIPSYFLKRKGFLDRVIYSWIRLADEGVAHELYFRLVEGEQSFDELARLYSEGSEAITGGLVGPVEVGTLPEGFAYMLRGCTVGQINLPVRLGQHWVIVRLEQWIGVELDRSLYQRLLNEQFELWFRSEMEKLSGEERIWLGVPTPQ